MSYVVDGLKYYLGITLQGQRKTRKNPIQGNLSYGGDLNLRPDYKAPALRIQMQYSMLVTLKI
jgi:hypothetical protein